MNGRSRPEDYANKENVEYVLNNAIKDGVCVVTLLEKHLSKSELNNTLATYATLDQFSKFAEQFKIVQSESPICLKKAYAAASTFKTMSAIWGDPAGLDLSKRAEEQFLTLLDVFLEEKTSFNVPYISLRALLEHVSSGLGVGNFKQEITSIHAQRKYLYRVDIKSDFNKIKDSTFRAKRWLDSPGYFPHQLLKKVFNTLNPREGLYRICFCVDENSANKVLFGDAAALAHAKGQNEYDSRLIRCPRQSVLNCGFTENIDQEYSEAAQVNARMYYKSETLSATNQSLSDTGIPFSEFEIYANGSWQNLQTWIQAQNAKTSVHSHPIQNNTNGNCGSLIQKIANALGLGR